MPPLNQSMIDYRLESTSNMSFINASPGSLKGKGWSGYKGKCGVMIGGDGTTRIV